MGLLLIVQSTNCLVFGTPHSIYLYKDKSKCFIKDFILFFFHDFSATVLLLQLFVVIIGNLSLGL